LESFYLASGMQINNENSVVLTISLEVEMIRHLMEYMQFERKSIDDGLKYLGFDLQPNSYSFDDWAWLIKNIKGRFSSCSHRWLSRGGGG
jgi:hypothetical protein